MPLLVLIKTVDNKCWNRTTEEVGNIKVIISTGKWIYPLVRFYSLTVFITKLLQAVLTQTFRENVLHKDWKSSWKLNGGNAEVTRLWFSSFLANNCIIYKKIFICEDYTMSKTCQTFVGHSVYFLWYGKASGKMRFCFGNQSDANFWVSLQKYDYGTL